MIEAMTEKPHERLDRLMNARRKELGLYWNEVAAAARVREQTLGAVRKGENSPSDMTRIGLDRALEWEAGSVDAILRGGNPTPLNEAPVSDSAGVPTLAEVAAELRELREEVRALHDRVRTKRDEQRDRDAG